MPRAALAVAIAVAAAVGAMPVHAAAASPKDAALWAEAAKLPNLWEGTWQGETALYGFPPPIQYTPFGEQYVKAYKPADDTTLANCKQWGMPMIMRNAAMPLKFFWSPHEKMISIYIETTAVTRFIHMDGRQHSEHPNPTYFGESIGHWEGNTLVVDSIGFVKETQFQIGQATPPAGAAPGRFATPIFAQHSPDLRIVERFKMLDDNTFELSTTLIDPKYFAQPYTYSDKFYRHVGRRSESQEWVCSDNRDYYDPSTGKLEYDVKAKAVSQ